MTPPRASRFVLPLLSYATRTVVAGADLMGRDRNDHGYFRVPRAVAGLIGTHVVSVHCGSNFTLAVDRDGITHR